MDLLRSLVLLLLLFLPSATALAQDYPSPPDRDDRALLSWRSCRRDRSHPRDSHERTTQAVVVIENVVGAGGTIGTNRVAKTTPDGYMPLLMHGGPATAPTLCQIALRSDWYRDGRFDDPDHAA